MCPSKYVQYVLVLEAWGSGLEWRGLAKFKGAGLGSWGGVVKTLWTAQSILYIRFHGLALWFVLEPGGLRRPIIIQFRGKFLVQAKN